MTQDYLVTSSIESHGTDTYAATKRAHVEPSIANTGNLGSLALLCLLLSFGPVTAIAKDTPNPSPQVGANWVVTVANGMAYLTGQLVNGKTISVLHGAGPIDSFGTVDMEMRDLYQNSTQKVVNQGTSNANDQDTATIIFSCNGLAEGIATYNGNEFTIKTSTDQSVYCPAQ